MKALTAASLVQLSQIVLVQCDGKKTGDPASCVNPVCKDKMDFFFKAKKMYETDHEKPKSEEKQQPTSSLNNNNNNNAIIESKSEEEFDDSICPLGKSEVGKSSWNLFHTMAAYYPDNPTEEDKQAMLGFINAIARFYPCTECRVELQKTVVDVPPR